MIWLEMFCLFLLEISTHDNYVTVRLVQMQINISAKKTCMYLRKAIQESYSLISDRKS